MLMVHARPPRNDFFCHYIDMIFTGIQGSTSRYNLEMTDKGLMVIDTKTGKRIPAVLARKNKNSQEYRWFIWNEKKKFILAPKQYVLPQKGEQ